MRASACVLVLLSAAVLAPGSARASGKAVEGAVNLNTASPEVLALLPGIGPSKAQSILVYRTRHPFRTVDELVRIKGIGRKMVRRLRAHLAVGGPTTATVTATAVPSVTPPPPPAAKKLPVCVAPPARPTRPVSRSARPTHGACPPPP